MKTEFAKHVQKVLAEQLKDESIASKPAYAVLDIAFEIDRLREDLQEKATFIARKATRYSEGLSSESRASSLDNPVSYQSTIFDLAKNESALEVNERCFKTMVRALYGQETLLAMYPQ